jgi:hypothetical protein
MPMKNKSWNYGKVWGIIPELVICMAQYVAFELNGDSLIVIKSYLI